MVRIAKRFEVVESSSSKFWEVWLDGNAICTQHGKIGVLGTSTVKDHDAIRK